MRLPNPRYVGDGLYVRHDGDMLYIEHSNGITVLDRIAVSGDALQAIGRYREYLQEFYDNDQHQLDPDCELCGNALHDNRGPIVGTVRGEVYRVDGEDGYREIRLCPDCAKPLDQATVDAILAKRG